jgi:SAM-dependent MidA family methyltransferase
MGSYNAAMRDGQPESVSTALATQVAKVIIEAGGWIPFDRYMELALYAPGLGYYARGTSQFGALPRSGSDFVTAPELTPLFGFALARQVSQALQASGTAEVFEFGAGSGALAEHLITALDEAGTPLTRYAIVDLSGALRGRQQSRLARFAGRVEWLDAWPAALSGVAVANELLDAMPVKLLRWDGAHWHERGLGLSLGSRLSWSDRPTSLRPPVDTALVPGTVVEIHPHAHAFIGSLGERLSRGAAFFVDYGFPAPEYYHPQRTGGTLMCHRGHVADTDPLIDPGLKDITAHVDFTGVALAAQDVGLELLGYTSQARFLINCGILSLLTVGDVRQTAAVQKLLNEHEMGELFKVIGFARGCEFDAIGFAEGDRSHRL